MPATRTVPARFRAHLARLADPHAPDAALVARFAADRDEAAFAELVRRHGPAVLGVCRRITGNPHDADDAFQATFLVLARKADRVRPGSAVGAFLYGVALKAARAALARSCRRTARETPVAAVPDGPTPDPAGPDPETVRAVLDEVGRLSEAYRSAVVLCELEGRPRAAAARQLGVPEGTLSSRLAAARKVLADRLRDRGFAPAAVLAAVGGVSVPAALADEAVRLAGASEVSNYITELAEAAMRTTTLAKWKLAPALLAGLTAVGLAGAGEPEKAAPKATPAAETAPAVAPAKPVREGQLFAWVDGKPTLLKPDGTRLRQFEATHPNEEGCVRLSRDGRWVAYTTAAPESPKPDPIKGGRILIGAADGSASTDTGCRGIHVLWSADGRTLYGTEFHDDAKTLEDAVVNWSYDRATGVRTRLALPKGFVLLDQSPDGAHFLACEMDMVNGSQENRSYLLSADFKTRTRLFEAERSATGLQLSPDGRKVLGVRNIKAGDKAFLVYDVATKAATVLPTPAGTPGWACWSPDGTKVAYSWREERWDLPQAVYSFLVRNSSQVFNRVIAWAIRNLPPMFICHVTVADADGRDPKTVLSIPRQRIAQIDWR